MTAAILRAGMLPTDDDPARLWGLYLQLVSVEEAFRNLKGDLAIRPIFHQDAARPVAAGVRRPTAEARGTGPTVAGRKKTATMKRRVGPASMPPLARERIV